MVPNQTKRRNHNYIDSRNIKMKADCHGLPMEAAVEGPLFTNDHEQLNHCCTYLFKCSSMLAI